MLLTTLSACLVATITAAAAPLTASLETAPAQPRPDIGESARMARVPLTQAIAAAEKLGKGKAVEAELETEDDEAGAGPMYEVIVITPTGTMVEIEVDARTGKATLHAEDADKDGDEMGEHEGRDEVEGDRDEGGDDREDGDDGEGNEDDGRDAAATAAGYRKALAASGRSLAQLVEEAAGMVHGTPVSASLEGSDHPTCEVVVVCGRYLLEFDLDAKSGEVREVELAGGLDNDEHDDHDRDAQGNDRDGEHEDGDDGDEDEDDDDDR